MPAHVNPPPPGTPSATGSRWRLGSAGYSRIEWLIIGAVIVVIVAGAVVLGRMVASSMGSGTVAPASPSATSQTLDCQPGEWFDATARACVPHATCAADEEYLPATNTCAPLPPSITAVAPSSGLSTGGTEIRISGTAFLEGATVTIGGLPAVDVQWVSGQAITAVTPPSDNLYPVDVVVTNPTGTGARLDNAFTYVPPPVQNITEVNPPTGSTSGGEAVIVRGVDFVDGAVVSFAGRPATDVVVLNANTIRAITPIGKVGPATVNVRNPGQDPFTLEDGFRYVNQPPRVVMIVRPAEGAAAGGTKITIAGTGFAPDAEVSVGGAKATKVKVVSSTKITAVTPPGPLGPADVSVRNPGLPAAILAEAFTYVEAPTVESVAPVEGPQTGGTKVTIVGTGFDPKTAVSFGGVAATDVKVVSPTKITAVSPPGEVGPVAVSVENPKQPVGTLKKAFTYTAASEPTPAPSTGPGRLPRCQALTVPDVSGAAGSTVTLTAADLFPDGLTSPTLADVAYTGDSSGADDNSVTWQSRPARIVWSVAPEAGRSGTITFAYTSSSCTGFGAGSVRVESN